MKTHGKLFWVNMILGIILTVIAVLDVIMVIAFNTAWIGISHKKNPDMSWNVEEDSEEKSGDSQFDYYQWYTRMKVEKAEAELLGDTYENAQAETGYQFYKVSIQVKNEGTMSGIGKSIDTDFKGTDYGDVREYIEDNSRYAEMDMESYEVIPAAQRGTEVRIIQVKNGITQVDMTYSDDVNESGVCRVKLP